MKSLKKKNNNNGRLPQGSMRQILAGLRAAGVESDRDRLNYLVSKQQQKVTKKQQQTAPPVNDVTTESLVDASTLTNSNLEIDAALKKRGRRVGTTIVSKYEIKEKNQSVSMR
jgi:hypothetical protein